MPNIPMWQAPTPTQTMQPQADPTMGNVPAQFSPTQSYIDPKALAKALGGGQGTGMPDATAMPTVQNGPMALGNGQDTSQMTQPNAQGQGGGYPVGGTAQMQNQQNFMGNLGGNGNPNASWMPSWFQGGSK